jgi:transcriptional regulator with XRE-family HTH domain
LGTIDKIREVTKEKGWSMSYLCEQMGVARVFFNDIKRANRPIPSDRLNQIAAILDVSVDYLLGKTDKKKAPVESDKGDRSAMEQEFIELYHRLTPDQKKTVAALINALLEDKE